MTTITTTTNEVAKAVQEALAGYNVHLQQHIVDEWLGPVWGVIDIATTASVLCIRSGGYLFAEPMYGLLFPCADVYHYFLLLQSPTHCGQCTPNDDGYCACWRRKYIHYRRRSLILL